MGQYRNRFIWSLVIAAVFILLVACPAMAVEIRQGDSLVIPEGNLKGPLFAAGNNVIINSNVEGDVFCAGQNITVNGVINGDLLAAGQIIRVNGVVTGDVRAAANQIDINNEVQASVTGFANTIALLQGSRVERDVLLFGNTVQNFGTIDGQFLGSAQQIVLNGTINNDVKIWDVQNLSIGPTAVITGTLAYGSSAQADISPQAQVTNVIREEKAPAPVTGKPEKRFSWWAALGWFAAGVLLWGVAYLLFPRTLESMGEVAREKPGQSLGWGFLLLLVTPLAALILFITVIGIPLALILVFAYILLLFVAKIMVGDALGRYLANRFAWEDRVPIFFTFLITYLLLILLSKIPVLGFLINIIIASTALGMAALSFSRWRIQHRTPPPER